jgi:hypothetical protein
MASVRWLIGVAVGMRVQVARDLDFHPFFSLKAGMSGTVSYVNYERGNCSVRMDEFVEGCEHWHNEVFFNMTDAMIPQHGWYVLQEVAWPIPQVKESK